MKRENPAVLFWLTLLLPLGMLLALLANTAAGPETAGIAFWSPRQGYTETVPVIDLRAYGYPPLSLTPGAGDTVLGNRAVGTDPHNPYAPLRKHGPEALLPGAVAAYDITLANYESVTRTYRLTDTLPASLAFVPGSAPDLTYDPAARTLTWTGSLPPGGLDYLITADGLSLPYLDLADYGAPNLCADFWAAGAACRDTAVTFNLGVNGYTAMLYGQPQRQVTVAVNGVVSGSAGAPAGENQWLPHAATSGPLLAGLWWNADMGAAPVGNGRWHAAILRGLLPGYDLFYAQWHDAAHAADPDLTVRHAVALVLGETGELAGHIFFIYDNISAPAQLAAQGYTIGIADRIGQRGRTYAHAACCGSDQAPQGYPPPAGTTLQLRPVLFSGSGAYWRTFRYAARVIAPPPETVVNTVTVRSSSPDPALAAQWATHYLAVRWRVFLPLLQRAGGGQ